MPKWVLWLLGTLPHPHTPDTALGSKMLHRSALQAINLLKLTWTILHFYLNETVDMMSVFQIYNWGHPCPGPLSDWKSCVQGGGGTPAPVKTGGLQDMWRSHLYHTPISRLLSGNTSPWPWGEPLDPHRNRHLCGSRCQEERQLSVPGTDKNSESMLHPPEWQAQQLG
jgi:hypothetical protein